MLHWSQTFVYDVALPIYIWAALCLFHGDDGDDGGDSLISGHCEV